MRDRLTIPAIWYVPCVLASFFLSCSNNPASTENHFLLEGKWHVTMTLVSTDIAGSDSVISGTWSFSRGTNGIILQTQASASSIAVALEEEGRFSAEEPITALNAVFDTCQQTINLIPRREGKVQLPSATRLCGTLNLAYENTGYIPAGRHRGDAAVTYIFRGVKE